MTPDKYIEERKTRLRGKIDSYKELLEETTKKLQKAREELFALTKEQDPNL